jgi:hypothetical protein
LLGALCNDERAVHSGPAYQFDDDVRLEYYRLQKIPNPPDDSDIENMPACDLVDRKRNFPALRACFRRKAK